MSVCVGIDVHSKRSQVAVAGGGGEVLANRNVPNGVRPILSVIGELPAGTPAAFEAAFGWGWLLELLEGYGFEPHMVHPLQCKAIASARLKNDLLTELPDVSAAQAGCAARRPVIGMTERSGSPCCCSRAASPIATGTGHTHPNRSAAFSSLPIFGVSRSAS